MTFDRHEAECARVEAEFNSDTWSDEVVRDEYLRLECLRIANGRINYAGELFRFIKAGE